MSAYLIQTNLYNLFMAFEVLFVVYTLLVLFS